MGWSAEEYRRQLLSLLPKGSFWTRAVTAEHSQYMHALGEEYARFDTRTETLIEESYPLKTTELIAEHEEDYGIENEDVQVTTSLQERRNQVNAKLIAVGQQNAGYFEDIASSLEYDVTVTLNIPFRAGIGVAGDPCGDGDLIYKWIVYVNTEALVESRQVNLSRLIFEIESRKPAHTQVFFAFYGPAFSREFSADFDRIPYYDNNWPELDFGRGFDNSFANAYDYDGVYLTGSFDKDFGIAFDRRPGGAFSYDEFGIGFDKII